jgi:hypothetical protein
MKLRLILVFACVLGPWAASARADFTGFSHLGQPVRPRGAVQEDLLAQRTIDREWGPAEDSTYHVVDVPGWKSEGLALMLSGAVPGAGHLYLGESGGWAFACGEAAFWLGRWYEARSARQEWDNLARFIGDPYDSSSTFSFVRYVEASGQSSADLERLWQGDRGAFYRELNDNPDALMGFAADAALVQQVRVHNMLDAHDVSLRHEWLFDAALWANHLLAALDALRAARAHNAPLREQYHIELGRSSRNGQRELRAALVRRF